MCLSFFFYYPRLKFTAGVSHIDDNVFYSFLGNFPTGQQILDGTMEYVDGLNGIPWNDDTRNMLQGLVDSSTQNYYCGGEDDRLENKTNFPEVGCSYIPPDQCSATPNPPTCCERISATEDGVVLRASVALLLLLSLLAATLG
ncbi:hypothetical protein GBAR_LOCUS26979 [Geodia barretti]|nr:hypothetical protein GBAR_LOCUS26979 [Geodia barretti]